MENLKRVLRKELGFTYANFMIKKAKGSLDALKDIITIELGVEYARYIIRVAKVS